jgi:hypothetical protein
MYERSGCGTEGENDSEAAIAAEVAIVAYFIAMRSCEITETPEPGRTKITRLRGVTFRDQRNREMDHRSEDLNPNLKHFQPFGCPVFVLDNKMQSGKKSPKWEVRSRMGIYLGMSMQHARSVALALHLKTGHVSPQFYVTFDPKFETVRQSLGNLSPPSEWQKMCGFKASSPSRLQGTKQSPQGQDMQHGAPFMEFNLEPGESVNKGEAQASLTPLPASEGEQGQEPQVQLRRSPRLNKTPEVSMPKIPAGETSNKKQRIQGL